MTTVDQESLQESLPENLATDDAAPEEEVIEELEPIDPPPKWDKRYKEVFSEWGSLPKGREYQQAMIDLYKEQQGYATKIEQERAQLRNYASTWDQVVGPYQQMIAMTGATPDAFVRQALGLTMQLHQSPKETLLRLAQGAGLDLAQLTQDQPYVDPQVKALQDQLNRMQEMTVRQQQQQAQEYQQRAMAEIQHEIGAFANAQDESGHPLHPHLEAVQPVMAELIYGREAQRRNNPGLPSMSLDEAYERACKISPEVEQATQAERKAQEAAKRAAQAKKELDSAKRPASKRSGKDSQVEEDIKETILRNLRKSQQAA